MKLFGLVAAQVGLTLAKTDVHFNHDHESPEIAQLEKWNDLAQKFFRLHEEDLRPFFHRKWAGKDGKFQKEIKKLERNFERNCSSKNLIAVPQSGGDYSKKVFPERKRRAGDNDGVHNPGHRMRHIVRNVEKWTEEYLTGCSNQDKVIIRWQKFVAKWEAELKKNSVFQEEFKQEEKYLRNYEGPRPCGKIYPQFGLHGTPYELYDAAVDPTQGIGNLGGTDFGNDELMSMMPYENCYIRAYQHYHKEGYSNICTDTHGCAVINSYSQGVLTENEASSVYCYCDAPKPKHCGRIFKNDGDDPYEEGQAPIFDGAKLGYEYDLDHSPRYVSNDNLSLIHAYGGCQIEIWEDTKERGDHFTCPGLDNGNWCHHGSLGYVGNDEASSIKCTCPVEFDHMVYDTSPDQWSSILKKEPGIEFDQITVTNKCDLGAERCHENHHQDPTKTITKTSTHNWGHIFKVGVSYTAEAGATVEGLGLKESITFSAEETSSTGGSYSTTETYTASGTCVAEPNSVATCTYFAYKTKLKVGYTIYWKNASPTHGTYEADAWITDYTRDVQELPSQ